MINQQPENTPDIGVKQIQIACIHGKLKIMFLRYHNSLKLHILFQTSRDQIGTDFENSRQKSKYLLKKLFIYTQSLVHKISRDFKSDNRRKKPSIHKQ